MMRRPSYEVTFFILFFLNKLTSALPQSASDGNRLSLIPYQAPGTTLRRRYLISAVSLSPPVEICLDLSAGLSEGQQVPPHRSQCGYCDQNG